MSQPGPGPAQGEMENAFKISPYLEKNLEKQKTRRENGNV